MTAIDFTTSRLQWHNFIGTWSNWGKAVLRRPGASDRLCVACVTEFLPKERVGSMIDPEARKARVSALAPDGSVLDPPPDKERDSLIIFNEDGTEQPVYRIVAKPGRKEPVAGLVLFWTLQVRQ